MNQQLLAAPARGAFAHPRSLARGLSSAFLKLSLLALVALLMSAATASAVAKYSVATGNWNSTATWSLTSGGTAGAAVPVSGDTVIIERGYTVTLNANMATTISSVTIAFGSTFVTTSTFTVRATTITVNGTYKNGSTGTITGTMTVNNGGLYQHNFTTAAGTIPNATWNTGSTCAIIGYTSFASAMAGFAGQTFYNFTWNCPSQTAAGLVDVATGNFTTTINGNFTVVSTGAGVLHLRKTGTAGNPIININGDFIVQGGLLDLDNNGGTSGDVVTLNLAGNYNQTGGTVYTSTTQLGANVAMNFTGANKTFTQSSGSFNPSGGSYSQRIDFNVNNGASLTLNNNLPTLTGYGITVLSGGTLNTGANAVTGTGTFTLVSGGTLGIGSSLGITSSGATGNIQTTTRTFSTTANYTYNGSSAQVTGNGLPSPVNNLTINNSAGVTLTAVETVSGTLALGSSGKLSITTGMNNTVNALTIGGVTQPAGTWGSTSSSATYKDDTRFAGSGILTVGTGSAHAYRIAAASTTPAAGANDQLTITLVDTTGSTLTSFSGDLSLTFSGLANAPGGAVPTVTDKTGVAINLGAATTITFISGVSSSASGAAILVAKKAESATLHVTDGTSSDASAGGLSQSLTVSAGAASKLAFGVQPSTTTAGLAISPSVTVIVQDQYGNTAATDSSSVTISSSTTAFMSGKSTLTVAAVNGVATFSQIWPTTAGSANTLTASDGSLTGVTSITFTVTAAYSIGNKVFNDLNNNGSLDYGESGISGVVVKLFAAVSGSPSGSILQTITTDSNGDYRFDALSAGDYVVVVDKSGSSVLNSYVSSTGNSTLTTLAGQFLDHGIDTPLGGASVLPGGICSVAVTVGTGQVPTGEVVANPVGMGQHGPSGDEYDNLVIDFGFTPTYSIGNRVFADANSNGIQDNGESGIPAVTVQLKNSGGTVVATATTDANGYYRFDNLLVGSYTVFLPTANFASGSPNGPLFGLVSSPSIQTGDKGNKGIYDVSSSANGIETAPITVGFGLEPTDESDLGSGSNPPCGNGPGGNAYDNLTIDFGMVASFTANGTYSIGNRVFNDNGAGAGGIAHDGIQNGTEPGIYNVAVQLKNSGGSVVATTATDASGYYRFDNLSADTYTVLLPAANFTSPGALAGMQSSPSIQAGDKGNKGTFASGIVTASVTVGSGLQPTGETDIGSGAGAHGPNLDASDNLTIDFGMMAVQAGTYSIGNRVYRDPDNDGQPDIDNLNEGGISGVIMKLFASSGGDPTGGVLDTTTTDAEGFYRFDGLAAGTYVVVVDKVGSSSLNLYRIVSSHSSDTTFSGDMYNHGKSTPANPGGITGGIASVPVTVGSGLQPLGEATSTGAGANGPNGDASDNLTLDFGFAPFCSIGNRVFADANNNGILDVGESGISGVAMKLYAADVSGNPTGSALGTTTTDASGYYRFDGLVSGTYVVVVDVANSVVNEVNVLSGLMSSTGASTDATVTGESHDHGLDTPLGSVVPGGIASTPVTVQEDGVVPVTLETDYTSSGQGAHGPNGDDSDNLVMDFGFTPKPNAYRISATTATPTPGVGDTLTIQLVNESQAVITAFTGDINLTFSGLSTSSDGTHPPTVTDKTGAAVALGTPTTITFASGVSSVGGVLVAYKAEGTVTLAATDGTLATGSTGGTGQSLTIASVAPTPAAYSVYRNKGAAVMFLVSDLLAACSDANYDVLSLSSVTTPNASGATIAKNTSWILYTPSSSSADGDTFAYTISDGPESASGTVTVHVNADPSGQSANIVSAGLDGNNHPTITFAGIPGRSYVIQRATEVNGTYTTQDTVQAPSTGIFTWTDVNASGDSNFYRTIPASN